MDSKGVWKLPFKFRGDRSDDEEDESNFKWPRYSTKLGFSLWGMIRKMRRVCGEV